MNKKNILLIFVFFICIQLNSFAEEKNINILSNELKIDKELRISTFIGEVYVHDENLEIWADKIIITLENKNDKIKDILAIGNVKIVRVNTEIYGNKAQYFLKNNSVLVTENVIVKENGSKIVGDELILDLDSSSSIMKSSNSNRVETIIVK